MTIEYREEMHMNRTVPVAARSPPAECGRVRGLPLSGTYFVFQLAGTRTVASPSAMLLDASALPYVTV